MVGGTPALSMSPVPPSKPTLSIDIASPTSSTCFASRHSLPHTNLSAPPIGSDTSPSQPPISPQVQKRVETRVDSLPRSLALLAEVCSSSNIRWDDDKQLHYMEYDTSQTPQSTPLVLEQSLTNDTVSIGALTSAHRKGVAHATPLRQDADEACDKSEEAVFSNWKEGDKSPSHVQTPPMLPIDFTLPSPTTFSQSSPMHSTCGYSSASERSVTLPVSSPDFSLKNVPCGSPEIPSQFVFPPSPTYSRNPLDTSALDLSPLGIKAKAITVELSQENKADYDTDEGPKAPERPKSLSPCRVRPLPSLPPHLELSPLSSLGSSPLTEVFEEEPPSAISGHFTITSSVLSSRSPSPGLDLMVIDTYVTSREKVRRASTNAITNRPCNVRNFDVFQRSDTAPPEHTPRKRRRRSSPSLANPAPLRHSKIMPSSRSTGTGRETKTLEEDSGSIENFKPVVQCKPTADSKPKKEGRRSRKAKDTSANVPEVNNLSRISPAELAESPMTGFMIETLALSRASAMAAPELLRAVLRSQPHLKEERSEGLWLAIVRCILEKVEMFGKIERKGTDAADHPLEDQWFYIPENDEEEGRAELLKGLMPNKRAVTKSSKQYYFEPVSKLSRWDPED